MTLNWINYVQLRCPAKVHTLKNRIVDSECAESLLGEKSHVIFDCRGASICWKIDQIWAKVQFLQIGHVQIIQKCNFLEKKSPCGVSLRQKGALNHQIWAKVNNHIWLLSAVCDRSTIIYDSWLKINNHIW